MYSMQRISFILQWALKLLEYRIPITPMQTISIATVSKKERKFVLTVLNFPGGFVFTVIFYNSFSDKCVGINQGFVLN